VLPRAVAVCARETRTNYSVHEMPAVISGCGQRAGNGFARGLKTRLSAHRYGVRLRQRTYHWEGPKRMDLVRQSDQRRIVRRY